MTLSLIKIPEGADIEWGAVTLKKVADMDQVVVAFRISGNTKKMKL